MERKWQLIQRECSERGYAKSAKMAGEIDKILVETYRRKHTPRWREDKMWKKPLLHIDVVKIAKSVSYCIGCYYSNCSHCKFAKKAGKCSTHDSLYSRFRDTLKQEREEWNGEL